MINLTTTLKIAKDFLIERALLLCSICWALAMTAVYYFIKIENDKSLISTLDWISELDSTGLRDYFWAWSFPLGTLIISLTLINSIRRTRILDEQSKTDNIRAQLSSDELNHNIKSKREELNTNTFIKSVEMLSSDKPMVRLGAIYSLEELMRASFSDSPSNQNITFGKQVGDTLASFIRSQARIDESDSHPTSIDTVAALTSLLRSWPDIYRPTGRVFNKINLSGCNFSLFQPLDELSISNINFTGSKFLLLDATYRNLNGCVFNYAKFDDCEFSGSFLKDCSFRGAEIKGTNIEHSELEKCDFTKSKMSDVNLSGSKIKDCSINPYNSYGVDITDSIFEYSDYIEKRNQTYLCSFLTECEWGSAPRVPDWAKSAIDRLT